ncbi:metal-dependent transcriptional regulator [Arsenicicoccus sp. oral taxon 190]|uniref:metal-dependent transcriptional regulator n=1 Tax=Arsenicicoccus sp. oral taxon 190 TaxID=1658671 RepID=UPI00067A2A1B|nr:metal-dependent transcriptional regulator [Arsenicicoccus sp. oral taxon 190]AKT50228.1 dihydrofolate reductase [Arsenicicoccus sp. oral taxon 190]
MTELIDTTEMYLRTIYELEEEGVLPLRARIAERLGHAGPTVSQTVARMERDGLLHVAGNREIQLSPQGRLAATRVMRKHRLAERLLVDVIGLEWEYVHDEACRWEHVMSERVERKILGLIGDDHVSPYGNPIPGLDELGGHGVPDGGATLRPLHTVVDQTVTSVTVTVRRIGEPVQVDHEALGLLTSAGALPGGRVQVRRDDDRIVVVGVGSADAQGISLPLDVASHVFVDEVAPDQVRS